MEALNLVNNSNNIFEFAYRAFVSEGGCLAYNVIHLVEEFTELNKRYRVVADMLRDYHNYIDTEDTESIRKYFEVYFS